MSRECAKVANASSVVLIIMPACMRACIHACIQAGSSRLLDRPPAGES